MLKPTIITLRNVNWTNELCTLSEPSLITIFETYQQANNGLTHSKLDVYVPLNY